jgi:hypothetical protein
MVKLRRKQTVFELCVVGQEKQTFTVGIQSSGRVYVVGERTEGCKSLVVPRMKSFGELREDVERLVKENDGRGVLAHAGMYDLWVRETMRPRCFFRSKSLLYL